jgi:hypothetical protein
MGLDAFAKTNLKSRKVRLFFTLLAFLAGGYVLGIIAYLTRMVPDGSMAPEMLQTSLRLLAVGFMLVLFLITLRWQILRTATLGLCLLSLAFLYCAVVLLLFPDPRFHIAGLLTLNLLFFVLFVTQSNLLIYLRDKTYADASLEALLAAAFIVVIGLMIARALEIAG